MPPRAELASLTAAASARTRLVIICTSVLVVGTILLPGIPPSVATGQDSLPRTYRCRIVNATGERVRVRITHDSVNTSYLAIIPPMASVVTDPEVNNEGLLEGSRRIVATRLNTNIVVAQGAVRVSEESLITLHPDGAVSIRRYEYTQPELRLRVESLVRRGSVALEHPRVEWKVNSLSYDLRAALGSFSCSNLDDPYSAAVTEQLLATAVRKHFSGPADRQFWNPALDRVEQEIAAMLTTIHKGGSTDQIRERLATHQRSIDSIYDDAMRLLAARHGCTVTQAQYKVCMVARNFTVVTQPSGGVVRMMLNGNQLMYSLRHQQLPPPWEEHYMWTPVPTGSPTEISCNVHVVVRWGAQQPEEQRWYGLKLPDDKAKSLVLERNGQHHWE